MNKYLIAGAVALGTLIVASGCVTTNEDGDKTLKNLEEMTQLEYNRMSQYLSLGTMVGASRLLAAGDVDAEQLNLVADALEGLVGKPLLELAGGWLTDAVADSVELTSNELLFILLIVEQEVLTRGGATYLDDETGELRLTARTEDLLLLIGSALRSATGEVTPEEEGQFRVLDKRPPTVNGVSILQ